MRVEVSFGRCGEAEVYWTGGPEASETAATVLDADADANTITVDTATGNDVTPVVVVYDARRLLQQRRGTGHKHDDRTKVIIKQERPLRPILVTGVERVVDDSSGGHDGLVLSPGSPGDDWCALGGPDSGGEPRWAPKQAALVGWLNRHAPAVEPFYRGALLLAAFDRFPGRVHFLTHAIREIGNSLPSALGPKVKKKTVGYEGLTKAIRDRWLAEGLPEDGRPQPPEASVPSTSGPQRQEVSVGFLGSVGRLIAEHNKAETNREAREKAKFGALGDLGPNPADVISNWGRWAREAVEFVHARTEPLPAEADAEWLEKFNLFEQDLQKLMIIARPAHENLDDLDILLAKANRR